MTSPGPGDRADPAPIMNDPDAIAPFSLAKKSTLANPAVVSTEPGFSADRAVYNVVRGADAAKAEILAAFGTDGFFCSPAGKSADRGPGLPAAVPAVQGRCLRAADPRPDHATWSPPNVTTTTTVTVTSASASSARVTVASVTGSSAPSGTVAFFEGGDAAGQRRAADLGPGGPHPDGAPGRRTPAGPSSRRPRTRRTPPAEAPAAERSRGPPRRSRARARSTVKFGEKAKGTVTVTLKPARRSTATGTVDHARTRSQGRLAPALLANGSGDASLVKKLSPASTSSRSRGSVTATRRAARRRSQIKALAKPQKG